jgi:hypothetical protein
VYVSKWLAGLLIDERSRGTSGREVPRVLKKIRDNVVFEEATILPFRRSGLWMSMKVVLQILLIRDHGTLNGTVLYKMILLKFMLTFLRKGGGGSTGSGGGTLSGMSTLGLLLEMMKKVARRGRKLDLYISTNYDSRDPISPDLVVAFEELMRESAEVMKDVRRNLRSFWELLMEREKIASEFCVTNPKLFTEHRLNSRSSADWFLLDYLEMKKQIFIEIGKQVKPEPTFRLRHADHSLLFGVEELTGDISAHGQDSVGSILYDFENNVNGWEGRIGIQDAVYVWTIFQLYLVHARTFYAR